ncbi:MAG: hypothetical protein ACLTXI_11255 [Collinsella sp.]
MNKIAYASEARVHRRRLAGIGVGRDGSKFKLRMAEHEANELGAGISAAPTIPTFKDISDSYPHSYANTYLAAVVMKWVETLSPKMHIYANLLHIHALKHPDTFTRRN